MKEYPSLAAVCHQVVTNAPSGLDAATIAELLGKKYATMMSETSRQPGHKLGADMILPIMDICDSDLPLTILARQRGGVYIPLPKAAEDPAPLMKQLAAIVLIRLARRKITRPSVHTFQTHAKTATTSRTASVMPRARA